MSDEPGAANPLIRRIVLWLWNEDATPERRIRAKEGLAYIRYGGHVDALDFGENLDSGTGTGRIFDLALLRDHVDRASWDAYVDDPHHFRVGNYIDTITRTELTARIDYLYAGPPSTRGMLRHIAMYRWRDGVREPDKARLRGELDGLRAACAELRALQFGPDLGLGTAHFDWVVESHLDDLKTLRRYLAHPAQKKAASLLSSLMDETRTGRLVHRMLSG